MPQAQPELKKYLDKRLFVQLNGSRKVIGVLRGFDVFLNIVLDEAVEEKAGGEKVKIGMVVRVPCVFSVPSPCTELG
ncbi:Serine/threonine-protein kinase smg1 [Lobaria immixta]|nr:Serine/threonine-protein kinase smg1 [Lobaria immixta]